MAGGVEGGEVAPQAASHQRHRVAGGREFDHAQLPADGEVLEIAVREIGDVDDRARGAQAFGEESGFAGRRGRGESVKVEDAVHFLVEAGGGGGVSSSVNLISASALNILNGW